jgi:hypothetical protein
MRRVSTNAAGVVPNARWKRRLKCRVPNLALAARDSTDKSWRKLAMIHRQNHVQTVVLLDQSQGQISAGGYARRGIERPVLQEDRAGVDDQRRIALCQILCIAPMRGDAPSVEQTRLGQPEYPVQTAATRRVRRDWLPTQAATLLAVFGSRMA